MLNTLPDGTLLRGNAYRIVRFINSGGFGCTYEAVHTLFNKRVAIKEFYVKDFCNRDISSGHITVGTISKKPLVSKLHRKFLEEAKAQQEMKHPGIVRVIDVFEENGTAYYVMDYIDGASLAEIVNGCGTLPEVKAVDYICQAGRALEYVHSCNRLHLDIKPSNIMVDKSGRAVLIDFGSSKQYDEAGGENTSTLLGHTPGYASPEQMACRVTSFLPVSDVYSLGATLYKLLSGITPPECMLRVSGEVMAPLPSGISDSTRRAVEAAMRLDRAQRPQSVAEFLNILVGVDTYSSGCDSGRTDVGDPGATTVGLTGDCHVFGSDEITDTVTDYNYKSEQQGEITPLPAVGNRKRRKRGNRLWFWILAVIVIAGGGAFAGYLLTDSKDSLETESDGPDVGQSETEASDDMSQITAPVVPDGMVDLGLSVYWAERNMIGENRSLMTYREAQSVMSSKSESDFRLPTESEFLELQEKCSWQWSANPAGFKVIGPSGNSIFLAAAGMSINMSGNAQVYGAGEYGLYLTSDQKRIFTFDQKGGEMDTTDSDTGYSVRMICSPVAVGR